MTDATQLINGLFHLGRRYVSEFRVHTLLFRTGPVPCFIVDPMVTYSGVSRISRGGGGAKEKRKGRPVEAKSCQPLVYHATT